MNTTLNKKIMRRVYMVWLFRQVFNMFTAEVAGLVVLLATLRRYVSIKQVLYNSPSFMHPGEALGFFSHAFFNTQGIVEILTIALAGVGFFILRDTIRRFRIAGEYQSVVGMLG